MLKNNSDEIKEMGLNLISVLSIKNTKAFDMTLLKTLIPMCMNGSREKEAVVKLQGEIALVNLLHLREKDTLLKVNDSVAHIN